MPKKQPTERKRTRGFEAELQTPIAHRRTARVATVFPAISAYTAHPTEEGVEHAVKGGHTFIRFTNPRAQVRIPVTGHYPTDAAEAEARTGVTAHGPGHALGQEVWHHVADIDDRRRGTIQLVSHAQHAGIAHWGGTAISKRVGRAQSGIELGDDGTIVFRKKLRRARD